MTYCYINPYFDKAKNKVDINILFDFYQSFEIESEGVKSFHTNEILLYNLVCSVTLKSSDNASTKEYLFKKDPRKNRISNGDNLLMNCEFTFNEIDDLIKWHNGKIITIEWQFYGIGQVEKEGRIYSVNLTTLHNRNITFPVINNEQWTQIIKLKEVNDKGIMNSQDDKKGENNRSKVLDDLLNYTLNIRKTNNSEEFDAWRSRIERVIEKTYGSDTTELKQIKAAMKLPIVLSNRQSEEQRRIYFDNLYRRRFNRIEQMLNDFKSESESSYEYSYKSNPELSKNIFIVHGHDELATYEMEKIIRDFNLNPIILRDQANKGRTLIQKFEEEAKNIAYAFVIYTPDDDVIKQSEEYQQARPNVIFELGWFCSNIGKENVSILHKKNTKIPSDLAGIVTIEYENRIEDKYKEIMRELKASGLI